ncbi:hypothetical protein [Salmonella phage 118970_sal1]|uniref:Uncharacterized protein n=1 Tax=Salmonella phage 118970_sal1 TaxID=1813781 RepID=A0A192Y9E2_9CAUD|nr:hypothetical protein BOW74_gp64 [Salmonella phage 118970_sal1]ANM45835.1 hypothetical protein [Salmonella phage 118970_sal1]
MRTINIFTFNELSDAAKLKAVESYREYRSGDDFDYSEYKASLNAFADDVGIEIQDWSYGLDGCAVSFDFGDLEGLDTMTGARAYAWLVNNVKGLSPGQRIYTVKREVNRHGFKVMESVVKHTSGVFKNADCCNYTGVFCDENLMQPLRDFLKNPDSRSIAELIRESIDNYCNALQDDLDYRESDEFLTEDLLNGDTPEFFENGTIYA